MKSAGVEKDERLFAQMMQQAKPVAIHLAVLGFFINLLVLPVSLYSLQVFDRVLSTGSFSTLFWLTLIMILLFVAAGLLQSLRGVLLQRVGDWFYQETSRSVMPITLMLATQHSGKGSQGLRDAGTIKQFIAGSALTTLMDAPWSILYIALMFYIHFWVGILVTVGAATLLTLAWLNEILMRVPMKKSVGLQVNFMQELEYSTRNADVIEAMGMADALHARWDQAQDVINRWQGLAVGRASFVQGASKFVRLTLQVLVTAVTAWLAIKGHVTTGAIIAASIISSRALAPFEAAIASWKALGETRSAYARLRKLLELSLRNQTISLPAPQGVVSVEAASYVAPGSKQLIVKQVTFQALPGEILGIIGPSGSGKSTLSKLLTGIWQPAGGIVRLDGADVFTWPRAEFGKFTGYMPQDVELFSGSVKDNIARLDENAPAEAIVAAAHMANAHELILRLADGYDTNIGPNGAMLSAGQRQRIALARAFYGNPKLLILDEPDASLDDAGHQALLGALLQGKQQGITCIVITHHKAILEHVDKLLILNNGQVEIFGPTKDVLAAIKKRQLALKKPA